MRICVSHERKVEGRGRYRLAAFARTDRLRGARWFRETSSGPAQFVSLPGIHEGTGTGEGRPALPPFAKAFGPTWDAGNEVVSFVSWEAIGVCALSVWDRSLTAYRMDVPRAPVDEVEREWALHLEVADPDAAMPFVHTSYRAVWADQWQEQGPGYLGLVQSPDSLILDVRRSPRHDFAIDWFRMGRGYLGTTHSADRDLPDLLVDGMGFYLVLDDDVGIDMRYLPLQARP